MVTRNNYVESIHYGFICIVNSYGEILYSLGDFRTKIFFRSSAKPIQIIPLIQSGAAEAFHFTPKEIALACASHSGQEVHQQTVKNILERLNLKDDNLHCGLMTPYNEEEKKRLLAKGLSPSVFHCSCSGKHSAMLALAKYRGYSLDDYENINHPVQQEILKTIADFTQESPEEIIIAVDGCGVPIYLLPINKIALSYARLTQYAKDKSSPYHASCKTIFDSMNQFPEMVAGDNEFCTELMQTTKGKLIGKVGSEAVYCLGIKKGNLGACIKIVDGNERAIYPVVVHLLKELGILDSSELARLKHWYRPILKNNLGEKIGEIIPVYSLSKFRDGS